jgi:hypothetical protein
VIPKKDLIINEIYECDARNFTYGIWNGESFDYLRTKFGDKFWDIEYHWDNGPPYGTVKPIERLSDATLNRMGYEARYLEARHET